MFNLKSKAPAQPKLMQETTNYTPLIIFCLLMVAALVVWVRIEFGREYAIALAGGVIAVLLFKVAQDTANAANQNMIRLQVDALHAISKIKMAEEKTRQVDLGLEARVVRSVMGISRQIGEARAKTAIELERARNQAQVEVEPEEEDPYVIDLRELAESDASQWE